jgi:hypothetical protein
MQSTPHDTHPNKIRKTGNNMYTFSNKRHKQIWFYYVLFFVFLFDIDTINTYQFHIFFHISIHSNIGKCHCYFDDSFIFNSHLLFRLYVYISILLFFFFFFVSISFFEYKVTHRTNRWKNHTMIQWNEEEPPYTSSSSFFVFFFFIESSKKEEKR